MSQPHPELLVLAIVLVCLALAPLASRLVSRIGDQISGELYGGRTGEALDRHLDSNYEGALQDDEVRQMLEAREFLLGRAAPPVAAPPVDPGLREEAREVVLAVNERRARAGEAPLDVEREIDRLLSAG